MSFEPIQRLEGNCFRPFALSSFRFRGCSLWSRVGLPAPVFEWYCPTVEQNDPSPLTREEAEHFLGDRHWQSAEVTFPRGLAEKEISLREGEPLDYAFRILGGDSHGGAGFYFFPEERRVLVHYGRGEEKRVR